MLDSSLSLFVLYSLIIIILPLIPGSALMMTFFPQQRSECGGSIRGWFLGIVVVITRYFIWNMIYPMIGWIPYCVLLGICCYPLIQGRKNTTLFSSPLLHHRQAMREKRKTMVQKDKIIIGIMAVSILGFIFHGLYHSGSLPTFADDSFGNWHKPAINILYDGGITFWGEKDEILGRGRLGYPIHIPLFKAIVFSFTGQWHDVYANLFGTYAWIGFCIILGITLWRRTQSLRIPVTTLFLLTFQPLVFWHMVEGYHELLSVIYMVLTLLSLIETYQSNHGSLGIGLLCLGLLAHIKNDGFVLYVPALLCGLCAVTRIANKKTVLIDAIKSIARPIWSLFLLTILPFLIIKGVYGLGFNQAQGAESGLGLSQSIHREIFDTYPTIFLGGSNYNIIIPFLIRGGWMMRILAKRKEYIILLGPLSAIALFCGFTLVFLVTENYRFALNQTTINRVYMSCFLVFLSFFGLLYHYVYEKSILPNNTNNMHRSKKRK